ncbi:MAG: hypothetical protein ACP5NF_11875, partial [Thermoanaerobaculum sp.]
MRRNFWLLLAAALVAAMLTTLSPYRVGPAVSPYGGEQVSGSPEQSDLPLQFAVWWEEVRRLARE